MLKAAQSDPAVAITPDMLDTHIYLLPCTNGTLDLRTFELREADPADYMTKSTGIAFDPGARLSPASEAFLTQITCGDEDLSEYIQKALGYALTGDAEAVRPWMREYRELARSRGIGADVSEEPGGNLLEVTVPFASSEQEAFNILDAARNLIDEAKVAAVKRSETESTTEQHVRSWWSAQQGEDAS